MATRICTFTVLSLYTEPVYSLLTYVLLIFISHVFLFYLVISSITFVIDYCIVGFRAARKAFQCTCVGSTQQNCSAAAVSGLPQSLFLCRAEMIPQGNDWL